MTSSPILVADSVGKRWSGRKVLASAFLSARAGRITGVFGRNGTGKSTLLGIAAGTVRPDFGTIRFNGVVHERPRAWRLAAEGLLFLGADRSILSPSATARAHIYGAARQLQATNIDSTIELLRLEGLLDTPAAALSGGERQRLQFALARLASPDCLLADEVLRGIDPLDADLILACMRQLAGAGCAVVVAGHEVESLLSTVDDVTWLVGGTTRSFNSPSEALASDAFSRDFLGSVPSW